MASRLGESQNTVLRTALREHVRRMAREVRVDRPTGKLAGTPPHADRVSSIHATWYGGLHARQEDLTACIHTRLIRDCPSAELKVMVFPGSRRWGFFQIAGKLTADEEEAVRAYLEEAVGQVSDACVATRWSRAPRPVRISGPVW